MRAHQQPRLRWGLQHVAFLGQQITAVSTEIAARLTHVDDALLCVQTIPGGGRRTAEIILADCGTDRQRVPTAAAFVSWAGFRPGQHESGGKAHPAPIHTGSPVLCSAFVEAAPAAATTDMYLAAVFRRFAARRGKQRALIAVGPTCSRPCTTFCAGRTRWTTISARTPSTSGTARPSYAGRSAASRPWATESRSNHGGQLTDFFRGEWALR